jgi:putative transposase
VLALLGKRSGRSAYEHSGADSFRRPEGRVKAIRRAIKDVFGEHALVHRSHQHKERNVTDLLPERDRPTILARIRGAWALTDVELAEQRLELLASELERTWPDAAGSLREACTRR